MERSFTARYASDRLAGPLGLLGARRGGRSRPATRPIRARRTLPRAIGAPLGLLHGAFARLWERRGTRIALIALLVGIPLLAGGYLLLRHSSFVAVEHVQVSGVHGPEASAIRGALVAAAQHMSTLDVHEGALRAAVAPFRVVREVEAYPRFPHGLRLVVVEQPPVAALVAGGQRTAVAADGVVLGPAFLSSTLPTLAGWNVPAPGAHLHARELLAALSVLGAAPAALGRQVVRTYTSPEGLSVAMRNGLVVYFGDAVRAHAKWLSLASVLAQKSSAGALYVDVRLPGRPAAGFAAGQGPPREGEAAEASAGKSESTVGTLAAGLSGGVPEAAEKSGEPAAAPASEHTEGSEEPSSSERHEASAGSEAEASSEAPTPGG